MFNQKGEGDTDLDTLIGENTSINGDLRFRGGLHVDGRVEGSVVAEDDTEGLLVVSDRGSVKGEVKVPEVVIDGELDGDVTASRRVELRPNARVSGNIRYGSIQMAFGAQVNGQLICEPGDAQRSDSAASTAKPKSPA